MMFGIGTHRRQQEYERENVLGVIPERGLTGPEKQDAKPLRTLWEQEHEGYLARLPVARAHLEAERNDPNSPPRVQSWHELVDFLKNDQTLSTKEKVAVVNFYVNATIQYDRNKDQKVLSDEPLSESTFIQTPDETLARGKGICGDQARLKYETLHAAGIVEDRDMFFINESIYSPPSLQGSQYNPATTIYHEELVVKIGGTNYELNNNANTGDIESINRHLSDGIYAYTGTVPVAAQAVNAAGTNFYSPHQIRDKIGNEKTITHKADGVSDDISNSLGDDDKPERITALETLDRIIDKAQKVSLTPEEANPPQAKSNNTSGGGEPFQSETILGVAPTGSTGNIAMEQAAAGYLQRAPESRARLAVYANDPICPPRIKAWHALVSQLNGDWKYLSPEEKLEMVNEFVNKTVTIDPLRKVLDDQNRIKPKDYFKAPDTLLRDGNGLVSDRAHLKYETLRAIGMSNNDMFYATVEKSSTILDKNGLPSPQNDYEQKLIVSIDGTQVVMENDGRIKAPEAEARDSFVDGQRGSMPVAAQPVDQKRVDLYDPDSMKTAVGQQISSRIPTPPLSPVADDLPPAVRADYTALLNQASIDTTVSRARLKNLSNTPTSLGPAKTPVEKLSQGMVADTMTGPASTEDHPQSFPPSVAASKTSSALRAQRPVAVATP